MKRISSILFAAVCAAVSITCSDTVSGPTPRVIPLEPLPPDPPTGPASLDLTNWRGELTVNETRLITVVVKDSTGMVLSGYRATFSSQDTSVVTVDSAGVVRARWPGRTSIDVQVGALHGRVGAVVTSRLRIGFELVADWGAEVQLAVGDTVHLKPYVSDANGHYLEMHPEVTWSSTNPDGVSVNANGKLTALKDGATGEIRAIGPDGVGILPVTVSIPAAGLATVRVAHAADGVGPITFVPTKGPSVTLNPGESSTMQVPPGLLLVQVSSSPNSFHNYQSVDGATIKAGEKATLYAVGIPKDLRLRWTWSTSRPVASDKAEVDVMQGSPGWPVIYIDPSGQPLGNPANCYFDWTDLASWEGSPAALDIRLLSKYPSTNIEETFTIEAKAGTRKIIILSGLPPQMKYFSFPDL